MIIQSNNIYLNNFFQKAQIETDGTHITGVYEYGHKVPDRDYGELLIVPGFTDIHTHGGYGYDTCDLNEEGLKKWLKELKREGVTSLLPTITSCNKEDAVKAIEMIKSLNDERIIGIHLEGPYLSYEYKGAQNGDCLRDADVEEFKEINKDKFIKIITLAPERDPEHKLIRYCHEEGIKVSLGHTGISYEEALSAFNDGAEGITHCYNAMSGLKHRNGGLVNFALSEDCYSEIIADGLHCHRDALKIFYKCKKDKAVMISDSLSLKGMDEGSERSFSGLKVRLERGLALLEDKTIAGSTLKLNEGLRICVKDCHIPFSDVLNSLTVNPNRYLMINDRGLIKEGYRADYNVLDTYFNVIECHVSER